jgi:hypothetical protein
MCAHAQREAHRVRKLLTMGPLAFAAACGGDGPLSASPPAYFTLLRDAVCGSGPVATDTLMQPSGLPPNAGLGYIDSTGVIDRPPRTVFGVIGYSSLTPLAAVGQLGFMLLRTPNPPPVGAYPIQALADSTVWLEQYSPPWGDGIPFDMSEGDFVTEPFVGTLHIEESDSTGVEGTFTIEGRYRWAGQVRCMSATSRFSSRDY